MPNLKNSPNYQIIYVMVNWGMKYLILIRIIVYGKVVAEKMDVL